MMKPIPRSLLIHTAAVVAEKTDRWGEISETSSQTLKYIRIEPTESYTSDKQNSQIKVDAVMYYDCHNSLPKDFRFMPGAKVIFEKTEYRISSVKRYDTNAPHHYEIGLSL